MNAADAVRSRLKPVADDLANGLLALEERLRRDEDAVVLHRFERSLQLDTYSCGAQSTYMILRWYGRARSPEAIARDLGTSEEGTSQTAIARLCRSRGLSISLKTAARIGDLEAALDGGAPVLVSLDDASHWAVVYGYSRSAIYLADPSVVRSLWCVVPRAKFRRRWDRWAMIVRKRRPRRA